MMKSRGPWLSTLLTSALLVSMVPSVYAAPIEISGSDALQAQVDNGELKLVQVGANEATVAVTFPTSGQAD